MVIIIIIIIIQICSGRNDNIRKKGKSCTPGLELTAPIRLANGKYFALSATPPRHPERKDGLIAGFKRSTPVHTAESRCQRRTRHAATVAPEGEKYRQASSLKQLLSCTSLTS